MELDFTKPETLQTRDGRAVRIYATDGGGSKPVHGAVFDGGIWSQRDWTSDGKLFCTERELNGGDLIPKPPRVTGWLNVYKGADAKFFPGCNLYGTKEEAKKGSGDWICQVYIDAEIQK